MKHFYSTIAAVAMCGMVSMPALGQGAQCSGTEGQVFEYDFPLGENGKLSLRHPDYPTLHKSRVVGNACVAGSASEHRFRGVNHAYKNRPHVEKGLEAAEILVEIGLTDPAAIKQLIDRVAAVKAADDAKPKPVADKKPAEPQFLPWAQPKKN